MSYMRALMNPDGLYCWRSGGGRVSFLVPGLDGKALTMPAHVLEGVCLRWWEGRFTRGMSEDQVRHLGMTAREAFLSNGKDRRYQVCVTFKEWGDAQLVVWLATWEMLVGRVVRRVLRRGR